MSTICDLCEEHGFRLQRKQGDRLYCVLMDHNLGPMEGKYRFLDTEEHDVYDEPPPYRCIAEEYVPGVTPIL